jgi:peptidoglycan/LPS O-acetylase OafA/YrhL
MTSNSYRADVDGLRAVAVLLVVIFHLKLGVVPGGFIGVDIFFVISGFVIAQSLKGDLDAGRFSIYNFYFRRARRIVPALVGVQVLTAAAALILLLPSDLADFGRSLLSTNLFVSNFYFWKTSGYFATAAETKPLLHTWSLAVEEQYYLVAPILFALIHRFGRDRWVSALSPLIALGFAASLATAFLAPTAGFFLLPSRIWELLIGAVLALRSRRVAAGPRLSSVFAFAGLALIVYGALALDERDPFPAWNALYPCLGAALLIEGGTPRPGETRGLPFAGRLLAFRPFVAIGLVSYSLYLIHWPVIALFRYRLSRDPSVIESLGLFVLCLVGAWAMWRFVEQPFRHVGVAKRLRVIATSGAVLALVGLAGWTIAARQGFPSRFPDFTEEKVPGVEAWGGNTCFNQDVSRAPDWQPDTCRRVSGGKGNVLLWGDSFAAHYTPGILADAAALDRNVYQYTFAGCPPILAYYSLARRGCTTFNANALDWIGKLGIDTVILSARWNEVPKKTLERLGETVRTLLDRKLHVVVVGPSPEFPADVQRLDYLSGNAGRDGLVEAVPVEQAGIEAEIAAGASGASYVDPRAVLCSGASCPYRKDKEYYYADYGHFSALGARLAVEKYLGPALGTD